MLPGLRGSPRWTPILTAGLVREPPKGLEPQNFEFPSAVKGGGVVINVTMDVLLIGVRGNDKSVPPLCPAHSQLDTVPTHFRVISPQNKKDCRI